MRLSTFGIKSHVGSVDSLLTTNIYWVGPIATMLKQANHAQANMRLCCSHEHMFPSCFLILIFEEEQINYKLKDLTCKAPNTKIAEFANTEDTDESADNESSHLDLQSSPSNL